MAISWKRKATQTETVRSPAVAFLFGFTTGFIRAGGEIH